MIVKRWELVSSHLVYVCAHKPRRIRIDMPFIILSSAEESPAARENGMVANARKMEAQVCERVEPDITIPTHKIADHVGGERMTAADHVYGENR